MFITLMSILVAIYNFFVILLLFYWYKIKKNIETHLKRQKKEQDLILPKKIREEHKIYLAVIIPIRNEAQNIIQLLQALESQTLDLKYFEVFVVNDASTDDSVALIEKFISNSSLNLHLLHLPEERQFISSKKEAINLAIEQTKATYILTTDGDCHVPRTWVEDFLNFFELTNAKLVSGGVSFVEEKTWFAIFQTVEFASLIGTGAACIGLGMPTMCNGANLAYTKSAFVEVEGFKGVEHIASGDDEFLLHKIALKYPKQIYFLQNPQSIVLTHAKPNLSEFLQQRKRWASKWKYYKSLTPKVLAIFIFVLHLSLIVGLLLSLVGIYPAKVFLWQFFFKCLIEYFFLASVLNFLGKTKMLFWIPLVQIFYPFYVVFVALAVQGGDYEWKGRKVKV